MNRAFKEIKTYFLYSIFTFQFVFAVLLITALCFCSIIEIQELNTKSSVLELMFNKELRAECLTDSRLSSLLVFLNYNNLLWFNIALPAVVAFSCVPLFIDEYFGGFYYNVISRGSQFSYTVSKAVTGSLVGMFSVLLGIGLYALIVFMVFPPASSFPADDIFLSFYKGSEGMALIAGKLFNLAAISFITPIIVLIIALLVRNKFLSLSIPIMINYISVKTNILYSNWMRIDESRQNSKLLGIVFVLFPDTQTDNYMVFEWYTGLGIWVYYLILAAVYGFLLWLLYFVMKRRITKYA